MHVFMPREYVHLVFNVDGKVGQNCENHVEDVILVQYLLHKSVEKRMAADWERKARVLKVPMDGFCDEATVDGIKAVQENMRERNPGTVVDGIVSPARGVAYGEGVWIIVSLNSTVREDFPETWPRLQDFADCPSLLKAKVQELL